MMASPTIDTILAAMKAPAQLRLSRYMARVEAHLPTLANDAARRAFLANEEEKWMERYTAWALKIDNGTASEGDLELTCYDFLETIHAVTKRKDQFAKVPA